MTFKYKLSRRLALLKDRALLLSATTLGAAAVFACEQPVKLTDPTPPSGSVAQVVIVPATVTLNPYQTQQFVAYGRTQAGDSVAVAVSWSTSGGTVTPDGVYTADTVAGDFLVTATVASSPVSASSQVKNRGQLAQVVVTPSTASVSAGQTAQFTAYGRTKSGDSVAVSITWSSTNPAVATVASSGLMTAVAAGSTTIVATSQNKSGNATASVTNVPVTSVTLSPTAASMTVGASTQLTATPRDQSGSALTGRVVTWATSNPAIATVSANGLVTGVAAGSVTITATSEGQSGTAAVTVTNVPVAAVLVSPATATVTAGATTQLTATPRDSSGNVLTGRTVAWASSNTSVATVNASGLVTGVVAGSATITATSEGKSGTAAISVTASVSAPGTVTDLAVVGVTDTGVTLSFTEVNDGTGQPASYDVRYSVGTIAWGVTVPSVTQGTCATPVAGTAIGAKRICTVLGLTPVTAYQFQLVAFRGTLTLNAVFGGLSNIAGATTTSSTSGGIGAPQPGPTDPIIFQDGFESGDLSSWTQNPSAGRYSLATDPTRVHAGRQSLQVLFTPTNGYGLITRWFMPGYDEVYVRFYVMFQEGFENRRSDGAGMHFLTICGNNINDSQSCWGKPAIVPNGTDYFYAGLDPEEVNLPTLEPLSFYTYWPDMTCCYGNVLFQSSPKVALVGGQWQEVVVHIKLNTPGQYDGLQEVWLNGVKQLSQQNMRWRTTTDLHVNEIRFDNYMPGALQTQYLWIDDVTVWRP